MSIAQISKSQFKAKALEYFRQVESTGERVIITDHGRPSLELRQFHPVERNPFDVLRGSVLHYDAPTESVAADEWEAAQ
jgi:antitoxin (DNA-binding transcriptional repressor) of toxin-antitoxin stability system